jgi:hypothetical protein
MTTHEILAFQQTFLVVIPNQGILVDFEVPSIPFVLYYLQIQTLSSPTSQRALPILLSHLRYEGVGYGLVANEL